MSAAPARLSCRSKRAVRKPAKESWYVRSHSAELWLLPFAQPTEPEAKGRREVIARGHRKSTTSDMSVVREGQPPDQGRRVLVGAAGERGCWCPAPGVLLPGCPAVASDVASAAAAQARFPSAAESA
jgi:hypothetical protein